MHEYPTCMLLPCGSKLCIHHQRNGFCFHFQSKDKYISNFGCISPTTSSPFVLYDLDLNYKKKQISGRNPRFFLIFNFFQKKEITVGIGPCPILLQRLSTELKKMEKFKVYINNNSSLMKWKLQDDLINKSTTIRVNFLREHAFPDRNSAFFNQQDMRKHKHVTLRKWKS